MKKITALILSAVMLFCLMPTAVFAADEPQTITIGTSGSELTQSQVNTALADIDTTQPFSVTIVEGVKSIGSNAFFTCTTLTSIEIPDSVTSIGNNAFYVCKSLTNITIPNSVNSIGENVFTGCSSLTSIEIPDGVTSIGSAAFHNCTNLASVTIPYSVISIGNGAFANCSSLTSITIPCNFDTQLFANSAFTGEFAYSHDFTGDFDAYNENEHWHICNAADCTQTETPIPHDYDQNKEERNYLKNAATCTENAVYYYSCTCGKKGTETFTAAGTATGHTQGTAATCKDEAICSVCTQQYGNVDPNNHTGGTELCNKTEATCTTDGYTGDTYCKGCNTKISDGSVTNATGHKWGAWQQTKAPTVETEGEEKRICDTCSLAETRKVPKLEKPTEPEKPTKPIEVTGGGTTESDPERDFWYEVRKEVEASDKGDVVTVNAEEYTSMPWYVMDALRDNGVGMKIYWDGETIKIPAGKALNEKWRTYYPFEYLAKYNFSKMAEEIPAVPETGVPVNAVIIMALVMAAAGTAIVLKKKVK